MSRTGPTSSHLVVAIAATACGAAIAALAYAWIWPREARLGTVDIASLRDAPRGESVRLEGDVTSYDAQNHVAVIQDDSAALQVTIPIDVSLRSGQRVLLSGVLPRNYAANDPAPPLSLEKPELTLLQENVTLPIRKAAMSDLVWEYDPERLEVVGIVKSVSVLQGRLALDVVSDEQAASAIFLNADRDELTKLIDARVALRGVRYVTTTPTVVWNLLLTDLRDVTVLEPPRAQATVVSSLQQMLSEHTDAASGHRVRARGRVLEILSDHALLLTDGTISIPVESTSRLEATAGTVVDVEGWPMKVYYAVALQGAKIVSKGGTFTLAAARAPFTKLEQVRRLSNAEAANRYPVQIEAVVVGFDAFLGTVFVRDDTGGIVLSVPNQPLPLTLGQRVSVRGVTNTGETSPLIANPILDAGAVGGLPVPTPVTADDLNSGALEYNWVELEGRVRAVDTTFPEVSTFKLITTLGPAVEVVVGQHPADLDLQSLTDAKVRARGVLISAPTADGQSAGRRLINFPLTKLDVLEPAPPDPFTIEPTLVRDLMHAARRSNGNRVHVSGTVTVQRGNTLYVEDASGGLLIEMKDASLRPRNHVTKPGDVVDVIGYVAPDIYGPKLTDSEVRKTGKSAPFGAIAITPEQAMSGKFHDRLVQIEARVLGKVAGARQQQLFLQSGSYSFEGEVWQRAPLQLEENSVVRLTGVVTVQSVFDASTLLPSAFHILVQDGASIEVITAAPRWNARSATLLFGAMSCATLVVLAWVWSLRRRVRIQTQEIEAQTQAVEEQRQFLRQVIDIAPNFIFVKDAHGRFTLANRALAQVYRTTPEAMIGKTVEAIAGTPRDVICGSQDDQEVLATRSEKIVGEESHVDARGNERWLQITKRPVLDANDKAVGVLGVANDVTQRKHDEQRLVEARLAAEAASVAKSDFLANMSHEIRTPLNGVIGMLDLMDGGTLDPERQSMLDTARASADSLLTLINDVLDFSKIEAGKLVLEQIDFEIANIVEDVATLFSRQVHAKGIELSCLVHWNVPPTVRGDPTRLRQVLTNLVSNAIKFTERGEVFIGLEVTGTEEVAGIGTVAQLRLQVRDTGIGMSKEALGRLFQAFTQADSSTTRRYGGTGLGLTIARRLVEAMKGTLEVTSELGVGSTFSVSVPLPVGQPMARDAHAEDLRGVRALIVDDNATNRTVLEHYLAAAGMPRISVASARAGLEAARSAAAESAPFDLILIDYKIPEVDGIGFIQGLKADERIAHIPCVVLSSLGDRPAVPETTDVAASLTKPVRRAALLGVIATIVGRGSIHQPPAHAGAAEKLNLSGVRVLLAEDNIVNQKVALRVLGTLGIDAELATNGEEAVALVKSKTFDAILMDCQMPVMDGYEATRAIREWERATAQRRVTIIAMTANALASDRARCLDVGMDDHLAKPFKRHELRATLEKWLEAVNDAGHHRLSR